MVMPPIATAMSARVATNGIRALNRPPVPGPLRRRWRGSERQLAAGSAGGVGAEAAIACRSLSAARSSSALPMRSCGSGSSAFQSARSRCGGTSWPMAAHRHRCDLSQPRTRAGIGTGSRRGPGQRLVDDDGQAVDVYTLIAGVADGVFGRVVGGALDRAKERYVRGDGRSHEAEVRELGVAVLVDEDVFRADVAVDDALAMGGGQRIGKLHREALAIGNRDGAPAQACPQRRPFHQFHHDERQAVHDARIEHSHDVWVNQAAGGSRRRHEALAEGGVVGVAVGEHLDRDRSFEEAVVRAIGRAEAAMPEHDADLIAPLESLMPDEDSPDDSGSIRCAPRRLRPVPRLGRCPPCVGDVAMSSPWRRPA